MKNAREAALKVLYEIEFNGAYSNIALKKILSKAELNHMDIALTSTLVYGVLSRKLTLDYMINKLSKIKINKLSSYIHLILRLGLYQLKFMDKIPESAAVNECVKLAKRYGHAASAGYVNGVLRTATKTDFSIINEPYIKYSFAQEVATKLTADYGDRAVGIMEALCREPKTTVRANRLKITREELSKRLMGEVCNISNDGIYVRHTDISSSPEYKDGLFTVQDAAPMAVCNALAPSEGDFVIDMCAAPGGKTTYLAELMNNKGKIIAFDIHQHRTELIDKNAQRLGISIIESKVHDASKVIKDLLGKADKIICDVPCSGIGIARRKPELKYKTDFSELPEIQLSILETASLYLKPGGEMIYSTCTLYKAENEKVIERFLSKHENFKLKSMQDKLPDGFYEDLEGIMTVLPDKTDCDGFFAAKLERCY